MTQSKTSEDILQFPEKTLNTPCQTFIFDGSVDPSQIHNKLCELMVKNGGIGLSANQIGINLSVFVLGHPSEPQSIRSFFNPEIKNVSSDSVDILEGCLSFEQIFVTIRRPSTVTARWQDSSGEWQEGTFTGWDARVFLHEYDHLQGITMRDRVSDLKWQRAKKKSLKTQ